MAKKIGGTKLKSEEEALNRSKLRRKLKSLTKAQGKMLTREGVNKEPHNHRVLKIPIIRDLEGRSLKAIATTVQSGITYPRIVGQRKCLLKIVCKLLERKHMMNRTLKHYVQ